MKEKNILIIDGDEGHEWKELFKNKKLKDKSELKIYRASWMDLSVVNYHHQCLVTITDSRGKNKSIVKFSPDFVIVRNQPRGSYISNDKRNVLFGLMNGGLSEKSINSLNSIYMQLERPIVVGELKKLEKKLGKDKFPLIENTFYSSHKEMTLFPTFPSIMKIGFAHSGMGKIKINDADAFRDIGTIIALKDDYCTSEPYINVEYGIRVQKIGNSYRCYKKIMTGSHWKSHFGGSKLVMMKLTDKFKLWADECSKLFGGLDILAVDGIHSKDGKDYIIELNGSPIGLLPDHWKKDTKPIIDLCIQRMNSIYCE